MYPLRHGRLNTTTTCAISRANGQVRADGVVLTPLVFDSIEEITFRFLKISEWEISEL